MSSVHPLFPNRFLINCKGSLVDLSRPKVMGILNLTPDSFHAKSRVRIDEVVDRAGQMLDQGATFLDIGGYSSRPGATDIPATEEIDRVIPAIEAIVRAIPEAILSVDTFRADVATAAIHAGAAIINDISAGILDEKMIDSVAKLGVPYVMMHMRGTPQTMTRFTDYADITKDVLFYFSERIEVARKAGISDIIIDPGFGFSKTLEQNFELLAKMDAFKIMELPILAGVSRKSMVTKSLNVKAEDALNGTTSLNTIALMKGAKILRVHDVTEAVQAVALHEKVTF